MSSRYQYRKFRKLQNNNKQNFFITIIIIISLLYIALFWILPNLIGGVGFIKNLITPAKKIVNSSEQATLAPPVLNIPYEATNTAQININGYASPGSKVKLFLDDDKKQTVDVSGDGSFNIQDVTLSPGQNNIYGKTVDEKGLESLPSKTLSVIYDNEKPNLNINEPEDNKVINGGDRKVKISGKTEIGANIFINGAQVVVDLNGNFQSIQDINEGNNDFDVKAVDKALNETEISRKVIYHP